MSVSTPALKLSPQHAFPVPDLECSPQNAFLVPALELSSQSAFPGSALVPSPQYAIPGPAFCTQSQPDVFCAAGQRDAAEKRLKNLERLLIRADPANRPHQVHLDLDLMHRQTDWYLLCKWLWYAL